MSDSTQNRLCQGWRDWLRSVVFIVLAVTAFRSAVADWNDVPTGSMKPTILEGDRIVVNKLAYDLKIPYTRWQIAHWGDPARGDIVVLSSPADGKRLVKRVIGLPGDTIAMDRNRLVVNVSAGDLLAPRSRAGHRLRTSGRASGPRVRRTRRQPSRHDDHTGRPHPAHLSDPSRFPTASTSSWATTGTRASTPATSVSSSASRSTAAPSPSPVRSTPRTTSGPAGSASSPG